MKFLDKIKCTDVNFITKYKYIKQNLRYNKYKIRVRLIFKIIMNGYKQSNKKKISINKKL